jgi:hypothetical protein
MKLIELPIGSIFEVPTMPQWGIMMISWNRHSSSKILVSLTGNRRAHEIDLLDNELEVTRLPQVEFILNRLKTTHSNAE